MTIGLPGSGKTTWALDEMRRRPGKFKRVNKDCMREMLDAKVHTESAEKFIEDVREHIVEKALWDGFDIIIDDTNFNPKHWESMCAVARRVGDVQVTEKYFDVTLKVCQARNRHRSNPVPEHVIDTMFNNYVKGSHLTPKSAYFPRERIQPPFTPGLPDCMLVDVDGTLAFSNHRNPYDLSKVMEDTPNLPVVSLVQRFMADGERIIFMTGRQDCDREVTIEWLKKIGLIGRYANASNIQMYMRKTGDFRPDTVVKRELYDEHIRPYYNVSYILDDRPIVCRMFRDLGFTVLQVENLNF